MIINTKFNQWLQDEKSIGTNPSLQVATEVAVPTSFATTYKGSRPSWYRGPKRFLDEWQKVITTFAPTRFLKIF